MRIDERIIAGGPADFLTARLLTIRGSNTEIGRALGEIARERYGQRADDYQAIPDFARARRFYLQRNAPIHWERTKGVAEAFGIDPEDDRYDFTGLGYNMAVPTMGCSVVYYPPATTATSHGYLSRNYDFSTGTMADVMGIAVPAEVKTGLPKPMSEPYLMAWYPEDGGYASIAIQAFDLLGGTLDGMNSAGLAVSIMADEEAMAELGPKLEIHPGPQQVVGIHELQVMRLLLDTCATVAEAKLALLTAKQYYRMIPCHYIVADCAGSSFIYENSTGRNVQIVIDGDGAPQVITNFQIHKHPTAESMPPGPLSIETNAFWRYRELNRRIGEQQGTFTAEDLKATNACVNILRVLDALGDDPAARSIAASIDARTIWHSLYDQEARTVEVGFYLGDAAEGGERRSPYQTIGID